MSAVPLFTVEICSAGEQVHLCCTGEIDLSNVHLLRKPLEEQIADSRRALTVDLRGVAYLDSAAVKELLRGALVLFRRGQRLRVRITAPQQRLLALCHDGGLLDLEIS